LLYKILFTCDWLGVHETSSDDAAVASLNVAVRDAMEQAVPRGYNRKSKFRPWFSNTSRYFTVKKNFFRRRSKKKR
jgi:hypothetical protein